MSVKKPSIATQLKTLRVEHAAQTQEVEKLKKELESAKSMQSHYSKNADEANKQLEQLQVLIDSLPGAIRRREDGEYTDRQPMLRLAAWFAVARA